MAEIYCKENNLDNSSGSESNSIKMRLTDCNIKRRSIITTYAMDITQTDDLNQTSKAPPRRTIHSRVSMNITVDSSIDDDLEKLNIRERKTVYSAAPMNITVAVSPKKSYIKHNLEEIVDEEENFNITLAVNHCEEESFSVLMDESENNNDFEKVPEKTIIIDETIKDLSQDSNEMISGNSKRKTTHVHQEMNFTGSLNEPGKSFINPKRTTIYGHEEMNMTEIQRDISEEAMDLAEKSEILELTPMISPGKKIIFV